MHRLRHPIRSITEPYGKAGLTVAILALVLATTGAAFAAAGLNSKQKKEVTKIAKKYAGKPGATGTAGTNGTPGKDGANGAPGESVAIASAGGSECEGRGGAKFSNGTGTGTACNGKNGTTGFTSTLPSEKTETGAWSVGPINVPKSACFLNCHTTNTAIPFGIPLSGELDAEHTAAVTSAGEEIDFGGVSLGTPVNCLGSVAEPEAEPGFLCIYVSHLEGSLLPYPLVEKLTTTGLFTAKGASRTGALLLAVSGATNEPELVTGWGTWAVTAG